jgi:hypothetical protein
LRYLRADWLSDGLIRLLGQSDFGQIAGDVWIDLDEYFRKEEYYALDLECLDPL